jgi:hypothetical protein
LQRQPLLEPPPENPVGRTRKAKRIARNLLDKIGSRQLGGEQRDIARQMRPHGFEALDLELQHAGAIDQSSASLETVPPMNDVIGEISGGQQAAQQHRELP